MQSNVPAIITDLVSGTDYRAKWVNEAVRPGGSQSIGHFSATYFGLYNNTGSTLAATVWPMDTWSESGQAYAGSGIVVNIPAHSTFNVYLGKVTFAGGAGTLLGLGSLAPTLSR